MATFGPEEGKSEAKIEERDVGKHKLVPSMTISGLQAEVFSLRFSPDGKWLAASCGDGAVRVFATSSGVLSQTLITPTVSGGLPSTIARWRPTGDGERTRNVLLTGNAHGALQHWHVTSGKCLNTLVDGDNQFYALDYVPSGDRFAAAGKEPVVKLYDEDTRQQISTLKGSFGYGLKGDHGHSNRIFSLKFDPSDPHMLVSGGWDNTVQVWDTRLDQSVRTIYGPHLCGDALDISGEHLLTGSWKPTDQVQIWNLASGKLVRTIDWASNYLAKREPLMVYAAQYSKEPGGANFMAAGGSGANEARVFDMNEDYGLVGTVTGLQRGVFTLDFAPHARRLAVGGGDATIRILDIVTREAWELERPTSSGAN